MRQIAALAALSASLLVIAKADALQITNLNDLPHEVVIIEGDALNNIVIMPGEAINGVCNTDCIVKLQNGEEYQLGPEDKVVLEGVELHWDDQEDDSATDTENEPINEGDLTSQ